MSLVILAVVFALSAWLTSRLCDPRSRLHVLDHPNERSLHTRPTPRTGGIAILAGVVVGLVGVGLRFRQAGGLPWLLLALAGVAAVSYLDDRTGVAPRYRLLAHLAGAGILVAAGFALTDFGFPGGGWALPLWLGVPVSVLFIVWMINLYNFMDGMDGFAAGMAVSGFGALAATGWLENHTGYMLASLVVAAAAAGFLAFNFPPARIFMGDVGSAGLGLLAAAFSLWGVGEGMFPFWIPVLIFSPFIVDATVTLLRRLARGERVWEAHRSHYYQRLVRLGWGHRRTVLAEYALMAACGATAVWAIFQSPLWQAALIVAWAAVYICLGLAVGRLEQRARAGRG